MVKKLLVWRLLFAARLTPCAPERWCSRRRTRQKRPAQNQLEADQAAEARLTSRKRPTRSPRKPPSKTASVVLQIAIDDKGAMSQQDAVVSSIGGRPAFDASRARSREEVHLRPGGDRPTSPAPVENHLPLRFRVHRRAADSGHQLRRLHQESLQQRAHCCGENRDRGLRRGDDRRARSLRVSGSPARQACSDHHQWPEPDHG